MSDALRDRFATLRAVVPRLNESATQAGAVVREVETFLESLGVGIAASVEIDREHTLPDDADDDGIEFPCVTWRTTRLGYGRVGGKFRIHVFKQDWVDEDEVPEIRCAPTDIMPWGSCPRDLKLRSFAHLPALLDRIADEARREVELADRTVRMVRGVIGATATNP
jgi:hypothetical protein